MKSSRYTLKFLFIALIFATFTLFLTLFITNYNTIKKSLLKAEVSQIETMVQNEMPTLAKLLYYGLDESAQEILKKLTNATTIIDATITKEPKNAPQTLSFAIRYDNKTLGYLTLTYSLNLVETFFSIYIKEISISLLLFLFLGSILALIAIKRINAIEKLAKRVAQTDITHLEPIEAPDSSYEIVTITQAINQLLATIKATLRRLSQKERHLREAQKIASMFSWEYHEKSGKFFYSEHLSRILGINTKEHITFDKFLEYIDPKDRTGFLQALKRKRAHIVTLFHSPKSRTYYLKHTIKRRKKADGDLILGISMDVTQEYRAKEQIEHIAYHDILTGLPNRFSFLEQLEAIYKLAKRERKKFALLYVDLDNFKYVNDTYGHDIGDLLLVEVTKRLKKTLRDSDLIFRIGGDEFVILLPHIQSKEQIKVVLNKILQSIVKEYTIQKYSFQIGASLGVAIFPDDTQDSHELLKFADLAMYEAKRQGKNRYHFFDSSLKEQFEHIQFISKDLKKALKKSDELQLYFQPKVDIVSKKIVGAEVLLRWFHPTKGAISPGIFIPIAEREDLIVHIDRYVMNKCFALLEEWQKDPRLKELHLAINLSAKEFNHPEFIDHLQELLQRYRIDPTKVELEITETISMENVAHSIETIQRIKELGFGVALDDFGTGYSSLSYLKKIPFDTLKIDRTFVQDLDKDPDDVAITSLIIDIAKTFEKNIVAEGVEKEEHEKILKQFHCTIAQGFLYYKPLSIEQFKKIVQSEQPHPDRTLNSSS